MCTVDNILYMLNWGFYSILTVIEGYLHFSYKHIPDLLSGYNTLDKIYCIQNYLCSINAIYFKI